MKPGDRLQILTYDNTLIVGTLIREGRDHLLLSDTNVHNDWTWIEKYNIKEQEIVQ